MNPYDPRNYHMTETVQWTTLFMALGVMVVIVFGLVTLWVDWRRKWSIEDYINGIIPENGEVIEIDKAHPCEMPRRPGCLGRLGIRR